MSTGKKELIIAICIIILEIVAILFIWRWFVSEIEALEEDVRNLSVVSEEMQAFSEQLNTITYEVQLLSATEEPVELGRYAHIEISEEEIDLLERMVYYEAGNQIEDGKCAVVEVVLNRVLNDRFSGDSVTDVIYAAGQFTSTPAFWSGRMESDSMYDSERSRELILETIVSTEYVLEEDVVYFATFPLNSRLYKQIGDHYFCYI